MNRLSRRSPPPFSPVWHGIPAPHSGRSAFPPRRRPRTLLPRPRTTLPPAHPNPPPGGPPLNINKALDKAWEGKPFKEVAEAPVSALAGVTEKDAELLAQAFGIKTIRDLANSQPLQWARAVVIAADLEEGCDGAPGGRVPPGAG